MSLPTQRVYFTDTYLSSLDATITHAGSDSDGFYVVFDKTIFHPQGGGQPSDMGHFQVRDKTYSVTKLSASNGAVKHYYAQSSDTVLAVHDTARLVLDMNVRQLHARLHSAGHLIEVAMAPLLPQLKAYKGLHAPGGQASINFKLDEGSALIDVKTAPDAIEKATNSLIAARIPVRVSYEADRRIIQFEGFAPLECGGTHVRHSGEIGGVTIRYVRKEKNEYKVGYDVKE